MNKIIKVLEFIENEPKTWGEIKKYCEKINLDPQHAHDILTDRKNQLTVQQEFSLDGREGHHLIVKLRLSMKGYQTLIHERQRISQEKTNQINIRLTTFLVIATIILGMITWLNSYYQMAPKLIGPITKCPEKIGSIYSLEVSFGNYGQIPTSASFKWEGKNIQAYETYTNNKISKKELVVGAVYVPVLLQDNKQTKFNIEMFVEDVNNSVEFSLIGKENSFIGNFINSIDLKCKYVPDKFNYGILVLEK